MARKTTSVIGDRPRKRVPPRQMDLFGGAVAETGADGLAWLNLPEDTRGTLVGLMTQLILEHARVNTTPSAAGEASHDH